MAQVLAEEVTESAGGLKLRCVRMQIQPIDAPDLERDVMADNVSDVGRHRNLLAEIPPMVLLRKHAGLAAGPNIQTAAPRPTLKVRRSSAEHNGPNHQRSAMEHRSD